MSEAVVPHQAEPSTSRERRLPGRWFARAIESDVFYSFRRSRLTMVAAAITALFFLLAILALSRSFQEVILAIFFVKLFGFGPFAGCVTLAIATINAWNQIAISTRL